MDEIRLDKAGELSTADGPVADPLGVLGHTLRLEPGVTLRSVFALLARHPVLLRLSPFLAEWAAEVPGMPESGCVTGDFQRLELGRSVEMVGFPGEPRTDIATLVYGANGSAARRDIRPLPLEQLLDMPLHLGPLRHVVLGDAPAQLEFATDYSLFDVLEGLGWQLGFHTFPKQCSLRR